MNRNLPIVLINDIETTEKWEYTGQAANGPQYYGLSGAKITAQVALSNFVGTFVLQGSLSLNPSESEWVTIVSKSYPVDPLAPTGTFGDTKNEGFIFDGNYVFLRARQLRNPADIEPIPADIATQFGSVSSVRVSL